ncbi:MAG: hypothetical protein WBM35_15095 [Candidatus Electrothrix sp.]
MDVVFQEFTQKTFQDVEVCLAPQELFHGPVKADEFSWHSYRYSVGAGGSILHSY